MKGIANMKRKLSILFIATLILLCCVSCRVFNSDQSGQDNSDTQGNIVFSPSVTPTFVFADEWGEDAVHNTLAYEVSKAASVHPYFSTPELPIRSNEIIIGNTNRELSVKALGVLNSICERISEDTSGYLIYAQNGSVAIVYNDVYVRDMAIEKFLSLFTSDTLALEDGITAYHTLIVAEEKKAIAEAKRSQSFAEVEQILGKETTDELKKIYSMFDERMYTWMANLWEPYICVCQGECKKTPYCGGGGFYFSNSGRNTEGFLPDIESTAQIIRFLGSSGMNEAYEPGNYKFIPEEMRASIVKFVQNMQDPDDGYFYHYQWGKAITVSRRGRDLSWCTSMLKSFYAQPYYDTPDGMKGTLSSATGASLTSSLRGVNAVSSVSYIIPTTSSKLPEHLQSTKAFSEYLEAIDLRDDSYYSGNLIGSQLGEIENAGNEYVDILISYLNRMQIPETGLWEDGISYNAVDGLMKMSGIYSRFEREIPNAMAAAESTFTMIADPNLMTHVCSIYNPWYVLNALQESLRRVGSDDLANAIRDRAREEAPDLLDITFQKAARHQLSDGSFFYQKNSESYTSQGALVGVPGVLVGDVNATLIIASGMVSQICNSLGIKEIPLYYDYDYDKFISIINDLGPVIKDPVPPVEPIDFNDDTTLPVDLEYNYGNGSDAVRFQVKEITKENNALHILKIAESAEAGIKLPLLGFATTKGNCYIFEADINYISDGTPIDKTMAQIFFTGSANAYALNVYSAVGSDGNPSIEIREHGPGDYTRRTLVKDLPLDKWFKLRVEYYYDVGRAIIYIDKKPVAESALNWITSQNPTITSLRYSLYRTIDSELMMDNLVFKSETKIYECFDPEVEAPKPPEPVVKGPVTFEGTSELPGFLSFVAGDPDYTTYTVETKDGNNYLHSHQLKNSNAVSYISFPLADGFPQNSNRYIFETELCFNSSSCDIDRTLAQIVFTGSATAYGLNIGSTKDANGNAVIYIKEHSPNNWTLSRRTLVENIPMDKWFKLRVEYYYGEQRALIYINNNIAAESALAWFDSVNPTISKVNFSIYRTSTSDIYLDNVNIEKDVYQYVCFDETVKVPPTNAEIEGDTTEPETPPAEVPVTEPTISGDRGTGAYYSSATKYETESAPKPSSSTSSSTIFGDKNKYVYYYKDISDGESNGQSHIVYNNSAAPTGVTGLVLELDIAFGNFNSYTDSSRVGTAGFQVSLYDTSYQATVYFTGKDGKICLHHTANIIAGENISLDENQWYNLRFVSYEYTPENAATTKVIKVYVNGTWACDILSADTGTSGADNIRLTLRGYDTNDYVAFDNVYRSHNTESYVPNTNTDNETNTEEKEPEVTPPTTTPEEDDLLGISGNRGTGVYYDSSIKYGDIAAPTPSSSTSSTKLEGDSDKYVHYYKDISDGEANGQAHILYENNVTVPEATPTRVLELDIAFGNFSNYTDTSRVGTAGFQISFYGGAEQSTVYFTGKDGKVGIHHTGNIVQGENISLDEGVWYTLRLESYDYTNDGVATKIIKVYVNNTWICDVLSADAGTSGAKNIRLTLRGYETDDWVAFDNVYTGYTAEEYSAGNPNTN